MSVEARERQAEAFHAAAQALVGVMVPEMRWGNVLGFKPIPGEVYELAVRFGFEPKEPGDDTWPWVPRSQRKPSGLIVPGLGIVKDVNEERNGHGG